MDRSAFVDSCLGYGIVHGLSGYTLGAGSFSEDARGLWYFNTTVEVSVKPGNGRVSVGVDLGLKTVGTCSDGRTLDRRKITHEFALRLAVAQRANKSKRVKVIHAKMSNSRKDAIHKFTSTMTTEYCAIFVGDVSSKNLAKTRMAKSVYDSGWHMLKAQLKYKAIARSVAFEEVDEKYTTQTCSCCRKIPGNSPKGRAGLRIREWICALCGATHDRDINAAKNILALGHERLAVGISSL